MHIRGKHCKIKPDLHTGRGGARRRHESLMRNTGHRMNHSRQLAPESIRQTAEPPRRDVSFPRNQYGPGARVAHNHRREDPVVRVFLPGRRAINCSSRVSSTLAAEGALRPRGNVFIMDFRMASDQQFTTLCLARARSRSRASSRRLQSVELLNLGFCFNTDLKLHQTK